MITLGRKIYPRKKQRENEGVNGEKLESAQQENDTKGVILISRGILEEEKQKTIHDSLSKRCKTRQIRCRNT